MELRTSKFATRQVIGPATMIQVRSKFRTAGITSVGMNHIEAHDVCFSYLGGGLSRPLDY